MKTMALAAFLVLTLPAAANEPARFTVTVTGRGPDVILIAGLASSGAVWDATARALAPTHRVHVVQVAGFAGAPASANAEGPVLAPLVDALAAYAATLDRPALVGHSLGGLAGIEIAARHPRALSRLLVVDALPFYALIFSPYATAETVMPQASALRDQLLDATDTAYAQMQSASVASLVKSEGERARVLEWALGSDRRVVATAMHEDLVDDARPRLPAIEVPVTIVYAYDPAMGRPPAAVDELYGSAYSALANAKLRRIDGGYHFIMLDQPDAFAREVEHFLR
jgi:pimeloyl-ACP methyl ester carboxylesterase